jgi:hypothetical protein
LGHVKIDFLGHVKIYYLGQIDVLGHIKINYLGQGLLFGTRQFKRIDVSNAKTPFPFRRHKKCLQLLFLTYKLLLYGARYGKRYLRTVDVNY